jgi:hypothetical protein
MLFKTTALQRIAAGEITLAFRCWFRPSVKTGGRLLTAIGVLDIEDVREISIADLTETDAQQSGHASLAVLVEELTHQPKGAVFRISFRFAGPDPRQKLARQDDFLESERELIFTQMAKIDLRVGREGWSAKVLALIARSPGVAAQDLASSMDEEKTTFKKLVRHLKELGLTESLSVGYRLSPRGQKIADILISRSAM